MRTYLAIDIGASSGRHIQGRLENGKIVLEEIHRFENGMKERNGSLCWDIDALLREVFKGISICSGHGAEPYSIGIDTWGVDFILLDEAGNMTGDAVAYRDGRTAGMDIAAEEFVPYPELFARTGIQKQPFNTVYQLMSLKRQNPELLSRAGCLLFIPDYIHYRLTGEKRTEYTIASTTGLINAETQDWDREIIGRLGFPQKLFLPVVHGLVPSHDTASAFLAAPVKNAVTVSSGTWSLLGVSGNKPVLTEKARLSGFSNEGGYNGTFRFLKNIMGLWMIQSVRRETPGKPSYAELERSARVSSYEGMVDVNDNAFFAPDNMTHTIAEKCREAHFMPPGSVGDTVRCVYRSLAAEYARSVRELEMLTDRHYDSVNITGGGSRDEYLNELTAQATGLPVYAGPDEGTALGNIVSQMLRSGEMPDIETAREAIRKSFHVKEILP